MRNMKHILLPIGLLLCAHLVVGQSTNYRVVFDLTSRDTVNQQSVVREIGLIKQASPDAQLEVVVYGQGLDLVVKDKSTQQPAVQKIIADNKASFKVCAMSMKRNNIGPDQILPGVVIVPDGIYEIVTKQHEGWGYIKVAH
jgi:uncharacterized protein